MSVTDKLPACREKFGRIVLDEMYQFVGLLDPNGTTFEINRAALMALAPYESPSMTMISA